jgi:hypothetical protein
MDTQVSASARQIATFWADGHKRSDAAIRGYARQVQDHLDHQADPEHLRRLAAWMSLEQPALLDLDMAMRLAGAPRPEVVARSGHPCQCRGGGIRRGGAPAPALVRQLIRSPYTRAA